MGISQHWRQEAPTVPPEQVLPLSQIHPCRPHQVSDSEARASGARNGMTSEAMLIPATANNLRVKDERNDRRLR